MSRFAILRHEGPQGLHWDLLLETGGTLRTWALPELPAEGVEIVCRALPDHRPAYLDYEGEISGQRGSVQRWDHGSYRFDRDDADALTIELSGTKLAGKMLFERMHEDPGQWRLRWASR